MLTSIISAIAGNVIVGWRLDTFDAKLASEVMPVVNEVKALERSPLRSLPWSAWLMRRSDHFSGGLGTWSCRSGVEGRDQTVWLISSMIVLQCPQALI